jgi:hypothetical protein
MDPLKYLIEKKYSFNFEAPDFAGGLTFEGNCKFEKKKYNVSIKRVDPEDEQEEERFPMRKIKPLEMEDFIQSSGYNILNLNEVIYFTDTFDEQGELYGLVYGKFEIPLLLDGQNIMWGNLEERKREIVIEIINKINSNFSINNFNPVEASYISRHIRVVRELNNQINEANAFIQKLKDAIISATANITERQKTNFGNSRFKLFEIIRDEYYSHHPQQGIDVLTRYLSELDNVIKEDKENLINLIKSLKEEFPNDPEFDIKYENNIITTDAINEAVVTVLRKNRTKIRNLKDEKPYYRDIFLKTQMLLKRSDKPTSFGKKKSKSRDPDYCRELSYLLSL